eukprot:CAMPEP_0179104502 /NCGR_PEP_ID=MMETSP0796-20121207/48480_1 /TAXON_ID=73915 /ORGANISM="Pyrodinium bahamense, Strain pbaha01" /LENGTH=209 /DNA_ID=CAMNT_0020802449 /DNA_START=108 /DNA_END=737 /DNA_ORIENTATION=+
MDLPSDRQWAQRAARHLSELATERLPHILTSGSLTSADVMDALNSVWEVLRVHGPPGADVHSKALGLATASGDFYSIYSFDMTELSRGAFTYVGDQKRFVAGAVSQVYGDHAWHAYTLNQDSVSTVPFGVWGGSDPCTGKAYNAADRPWYAHAVENGEGLTLPYSDPVTGQGMVSYVLPLRDSEQVLGVIVAGSFLDPTGDLGFVSEPK